MTHPVKTLSLTSGLDQMGLAFEPAIIDQLTRYMLLLKKWNKAYNLISKNSETQLLTRHILDCLSISKYIEGERIIDVGTGPGLPGLLLAITQPEKTFSLLDSNGKKTRFLIHVASELSLKNVEVEKRRVETYYPSQQYDLVVTRAFSSLKLMLERCGHLTTDHGLFVAMKGVVEQDDVSSIPSQFEVINQDLLEIPGLDETRHAVVIRKKQ